MSLSTARRLRATRSVRFLRMGASRSLYGAAALGGLWTARKARMAIGERVGKRNAKRQEVLKTGFAATPSFSLNQVALTTLGALSTGAQDARQKALVNLRGWKIEMELKNNLEVPVYWNVAVISSRDSDSIIGDDFFRDTFQRGVNFSATTHTALFMHTAPINVDKYNILWHTRGRLAGKADSSNGTTGEWSSGYASYMNVSKYVALKRQLRFDQDTDTSPENGNTYLCYWFNSMGGTAPLAVTAGAVNVGFQIICTFKDTRD